ncbi:sodium/hydrogen exchanger 1-like [Neocloeon triangulifer]|uniref:sodium/hydrogen exchanger 1-like n=1 Tax=Neocloeon triangulifer TaxID=2078957 RepID=UPI00286F29F2|nr:sodium/hydrogen exchanger 1-like [Neocloeon triangulifer]
MGWQWPEVGSYITVTSFLVLTAVVTIGFHHVPSLSKWLPESCVLILLGVAVGGLLLGFSGSSPDSGGTGNSTTVFPFPTFTPKLFFYALLPPVILESSYSIYEMDFASNIGTIMLYAVVGTILNTFSIGPALYALYHMGAMGGADLLSDAPYELTMLDALIFSALISAVDPVAVLAIFQETHIDRILYFLVFGESLLNDAVTVGIYHTLLEFARDAHPVTFGMVCVAFLDLLAIGLVGLLIGVVFGLAAALATKTTKHVRVFEPLLILGIAYLAYMSAELFHFSGIISIIGCGLVQSHYALRNVSRKSRTTVKYFVKMMSAISEAIIFLFLGMAFFMETPEIHFGFIVWTLVLCLICRFISVFLLTDLVNARRVRRISFFEQFIMAYGGLRGAVCFSLGHMLSPEVVKPRALFLTTTLAVIIFTVFLQGTTLKPLMNLFHIKRCEDSKHRLLIVDLTENMGALMLAGLEQVIGITGHFSVFSKLRQWDEKYLKRLFLISECEPDVLIAYRRHAQTMMFSKVVQQGQEETRVRVHSQDSVQHRQKIKTMLQNFRPMSFTRHNVEDDVCEEEPSTCMKRESQILGAMHIQGAWQRRNTQDLFVLEEA